jgi:hypothetical protein
MYENKGKERQNAYAGSDGQIYQHFEKLFTSYGYYQRPGKEQVF